MIVIILKLALSVLVIAFITKHLFMWLCDFVGAAMEDEKNPAEVEQMGAWADAFAETSFAANLVWKASIGLILLVLVGIIWSL
jgi:hypothetical protein